ncbi:MAG TPA: hypothetical protein VF699_08890 [Caulobacteraceae bacterium]|jgi:hypothetical protein
MDQDGPASNDPERAIDAAGGGMGDGSDPASSSTEQPGPGLQKELKEGALGQALASVAGQPGLAQPTDESKAEAGGETPAKE